MIIESAAEAKDAAALLALIERQHAELDALLWKLANNPRTGDLWLATQDWLSTSGDARKSLARAIQDFTAYHYPRGRFDITTGSGAGA